MVYNVRHVTDFSTPMDSKIIALCKTGKTMNVRKFDVYIDNSISNYVIEYWLNSISVDTTMVCICTILQWVPTSGMVNYSYIILLAFQGEKKPMGSVEFTVEDLFCQAIQL